MVVVAGCVVVVGGCVVLVGRELVLVVADDEPGDDEQAVRVKAPATATATAASRGDPGRRA